MTGAEYVLTGQLTVPLPGTVFVVLEDTAAGCSVTVTYELTALSEAGRDGLREFAGGYPACLRSWQKAIAASLSA